MSKETVEKNITVNLVEKREFAPPAAFFERSNTDALEMERVQKFALSDPDQYWAEAALDLKWDQKWKTVLSGEAPFYHWFDQGKLNASVNCLDRHLETQPNKAALTWEGETGEVSTWTFSELHFQVERATVVLRKLGLKSGDTAAIYMPLIPEAVAAMLACARAGITHTVVFGGFSAESLKDRVLDANAKAIITADFGYRKGSVVELKTQVDTVVASCSNVTQVLVVQRQFAGAQNALNWSPSKCVNRSSQKHQETDWHEALSQVTRDEQLSLGLPESVSAEHPLFILYTSGTTGKPKGIVHSTGGYLTGVLRTFKQVFDIKSTDLYWCTADIGWITGHSYVTYGPLSAGASIFIYEGAPTYPQADRFWQMIERHRISILYTAPTAIRAFMKLGEHYPQSRDLSSLRLLGTVGEPINPEAWIWYYKVIGGERCPIVDTYWQTETGAIVIAPMPAHTPTIPGSATQPLPGYAVDIVDKKGVSVGAAQGGYLVIRRPWPSMARTIHGDSERFKKQYFSEFSEYLTPGQGPIYFTGDGARKDEKGNIWCLGRVDDVLNVSGHRLGTMEIESALVSHAYVAEAAVVGRPDEIKGQGIVAFVTLKAEAATALAGADKLTECKKTLQAHVAKEIGAIARPDEIRFADALPKTRSGKIMRRLLRELAAGNHIKGDTTTLEDLGVLAALQKDEE